MTGDRLQRSGRGNGAAGRAEPDPAADQPRTDLAFEPPADLEADSRPNGAADIVRGQL